MQISTTDLGGALTAAMAGGYVAEMSGQTYTVSAPVVINVTSTIQGPLGIDLGGATIVSQITNGAPVIQINAGPGVDLRYLTLSNFTIEGNGREGDGIRIVADGNDRWIYNFTIDNVTVKNVGGYGLDVQGSVFEGLVSNSSMIGNAAGGAYFGHSTGGGQTSALRWYGGSLEGNGGAGLVLGNGARDISLDGVSVANNNGIGIGAEWGITSVSNSQFRDNRGDGIWFQNYGNFTNNSFTSSGVQTIGIDGYMTGGSTLIGNTGVYTGSGTDPTTLANMQGFGNLYMTNDTGKVVTGSQVAVSGIGGGNTAEVALTAVALVMPTSSSVTAATTAAVASSTGTGVLETALRGALSGGTVAELSGASFTVTTPIVINLTGSSQGPIGIDLGGAKILSQVTGGQPVIEIVAGVGVDVSALTLSNFAIFGNGQEGAGIKIVADGQDRSINLQIRNVDIEHVGGIGLDVIGNVSGTVFDSWMHGNAQGGARFANSAGGGTADALQWVGGGFRKNGVAGLILENGARDMTVEGAYFVENYGAGIQASTGIAMVEQSGFENNQGVGALVGGASTFVADTFSTYGPQTTAIGGVLSSGKIVLIGDGNEYYGGGADPTVLANVTGSGTLSIAGGGKVLVGSGITVTGGSAIDTTPLPPADTTPPEVLSIATSGTGIVSGDGSLNAGKTVILTATFSETVTVAGGTPTLLLNDGGTATYAGGSGSSTFTFSHIVQAGQNVADLAVSSLALNGATIKDAAGNSANLAGATGFNPAGTLRIDTLSPTIGSIATSGASITAGSGTVGVGATVTFTVAMSEAVAVTGIPTLALNTGGTATYDGGSGSSALAFNYAVAAGQNTADLTVTGLDLNGGTIGDMAGNAANVAGATNYNPAGTLKVDTTSATPPPVVAITGIASANGKVTLTGTSDPGAQVSVYDGSTRLGAATTGSNGTWSYSGSAAPNAIHNYTINSTLAGVVTAGIGRGLLGSNGADTLTGGSGSDIIAGGAGNDVLTGGAGEDTFAFITAPNATKNLDRITDFSSGTDKLAFARSAFTALPLGDLSAAAFIQAVAAVTPDQHVIYNQATGIVSYDADGSGSGAAIAVASLQPGQSLTARDIKVV